jgi:hypothetical protein
MSAVRGLGQLAGLFVAGLLAGLWAFIAPWVLGYAGGTRGGWAQPTWSNVWVGAIVIGASAAGLATVTALAAHGALRITAQRRPEEHETPAGGSGS